MPERSLKLRPLDVLVFRFAANDRVASAMAGVSMLARGPGLSNQLRFRFEAEVGIVISPLFMKGGPVVLYEDPSHQQETLIVRYADQRAMLVLSGITGSDIDTVAHVETHCNDRSRIDVFERAGFDRRVGRLLWVESKGACRWNLAELNARTWPEAATSGGD